MTYRVVAYKGGKRIGGVSEAQLKKAQTFAHEWGQRRDEDGSFWADRVEMHDNSLQDNLFLEIRQGVVVVDFLERIRHDLWGKKKSRKIPAVRKGARRDNPPPPH